MPFSQMGFTKDAFQGVVDIAHRGVALIDQELQKLYGSNRYRFRVEDLYTLSLKGIYGAHGVTDYHKTETLFGDKCEDIYKTLKSFVGENDALAYKPVINGGGILT